MWQEVYTKQQNKPKRNAENFLRKVDGEALFQLALLADAGDEEAVVLRLHDKDTIVIAGIPARLREFTERLDFLFLRNGALKCGYTKLMHEWLMKRHVVPDPSGLRELSIDPGVVARCFGRMRAWVSLAVSTLQCELPGFEVVNSFQVLDLNSCLSYKAKNLAIQKLGSTFKIPSQELMAQFENFLPTARRMREHTTSDLEAWRQVLLQKRGRPEQNCLTAVVARALLMQKASTASNERDFSYNVRMYVKKRGLLKSLWRTRKRQLNEACMGTLCYKILCCHCH